MCVQHTNREIEFYTGRTVELSSNAQYPHRDTYPAGRMTHKGFSFFGCFFNEKYWQTEQGKGERAERRS